MLKFIIVALAIAIVIFFSIESSHEQRTYLAIVEYFTDQRDTLTIKCHSESEIILDLEGCIEVSGVPRVCGVRELIGITEINNK